jgi:hypothetical protein
VYIILPSRHLGPHPDDFVRHALARFEGELHAFRICVAGGAAFFEGVAGGCGFFFVVGDVVPHFTVVDEHREQEVAEDVAVTDW